MNKKAKLKLPKNSIHEHLADYSKATYAERLIWLAQANKTAHLLQKAMAKAKAKMKG